MGADLFDDLSLSRGHGLDLQDQTSQAGLVLCRWQGVQIVFQPDDVVIGCRYGLDFGLGSALRATVHTLRLIRTRPTALNKTSEPRSIIVVAGGDDPEPAGKRFVLPTDSVNVFLEHRQAVAVPRLARSE